MVKKMTADIRIFKLPKKLRTPSDKLTKRELTAKLLRIAKAQRKIKQP
jgi:hypothetical protein